MSREHVIAIDPARPLSEQPETGHNRWHEAIAPVVEVEPGDTVTYETRDAFDGQLHPGSGVAEVGALQLGPVHPLTGPVYVKGAEPGDLLEAELLSIEADPWDQWGYTAEVPGFGLSSGENFTLPASPVAATTFVAPAWTTSSAPEVEIVWTVEPLLGEM